jgi:hypothetical protein
MAACTLFGEREKGKIGKTVWKINLKRKRHGSSKQDKIQLIKTNPNQTHDG